jgi:aryl-alcohol dehydrogenase-like predicted oxidoreductase
MDQLKENISSSKTSLDEEILKGINQIQEQQPDPAP